MINRLTLTIVLLLNLLLLWPILVLAQASPTDQMRASTYRLVAAGGVRCSAVAVAPGKLYTAWHCVEYSAEPAPKAVVFAPDGRMHEIVVRRPVQGGSDLAEIIVPTVTCPCMPTLPKGSLKIDEPVVVVGHPYGMPVSILTRGESQGPLTYLQESYVAITAPVAPGNSGGGTFVVRNGRPYLVGITSKKTEEGSVALIAELPQ